MITDIATVEDFDADEALRLVGAAEAKSSHPLAHAVLEALTSNNFSLPERVEKFENLSGLGVKAIVNGKNVLVGTVKLMREHTIEVRPLEHEVQTFLERGETIMLLTVTLAIGMELIVGYLIRDNLFLKS